jgi:hypothetical protein
MRAKIRKWKPPRHAACCIGCTKPFKRGDDVVEVGCLAIHYRRECAEQYIKDSRAFGIEPGIEIPFAPAAQPSDKGAK